MSPATTIDGEVLHFFTLMKDVLVFRIQTFLHLRAVAWPSPDEASQKAAQQRLLTNHAVIRLILTPGLMLEQVLAEGTRLEKEIWCSRRKRYGRELPDQDMRMCIRYQCQTRALFRMLAAAADDPLISFAARLLSRDLERCSLGDEPRVFRP